MVFVANLVDCEGNVTAIDADKDTIFGKIINVHVCHEILFWQVVKTAVHTAK